MDKFRLREHIKFGTRVVSIEKDDLEKRDCPWIVKIETSDGPIEILKFNFIIIATGLHSEPYVMKIPGQEKFVGPIIHPCAVKTKEQLIDKRVAIIGCGKCATDMAVVAGTYARTCYLIFRRAHWSLPYTIMSGRLPAKYILTRAACFPFSPYPNAPHTHLFRFLHEKFPRIFMNMTNTMSKDIIETHGPDLYNDKIFLPRTSIRNAENISMIPKDFIRLKREGRIIGKLASIDRIVDETTIQLDTGEQISADVIISASGYKLIFPFLSDSLIQLLGLRSDTDDASMTNEIKLNLYRRMIPVGIPNIAFLGFTSTIGQWMLTEVESHWISDYFLERLKPPTSKEDMYEEIRATRKFIRETYDNDISRLTHYWVAPVDTLLKDMGVDMHRTNNWVTEYFGLYRPERFKTLHEERRRKAEGRPIRRWYFGFKHTLIVFLVSVFGLTKLFSCQFG